MTKQIKMQVDTLNKQAWELREHDPQKSFSLAQQAHDLIKKNMPKYNKGLADSLVNLAHYNQVRSHFDEAFTQNYGAIVLYQELGDDWGYGNCLSNFVKMYHKLGDYSTMLEYALKRQAIAVEVGDDEGERRSNIGIGLAYMETGDYIRAINYFEKALKLAKVNADEIIQGGALGYIANALAQQDKFTEALIYYQQSLDHYQLDGNKLFEGYVLGDLANTHIKLEQFSGALSCFQKQAQIGKQLDSFYLQAFAHLGIGRIQAINGQLETAIQTLHNALNIARDGQIQAARIECLHQLADAYKQQGDFEKALLYFEQFHREKELVFNTTQDQHRKRLMVIHETQQAETEARLQAQLRLQDQLHYESLSRMKDNFISTTTHDLKSPLNSIQLALSLLQKLIDKEDAKEYLSWIELSVRQMYELVVDTLDIARLETGQALKPQNTPLVDFLKAIVKTYQDIAMQKNIQLDFKTGESDIDVIIDPIQMRRVMDNLLSNAIKYTQVGGEVLVELRKSMGLIEIGVVDNGPGISESDLPFIFNPYYRVENAPQSNEEGTGLGLSIVKTIVKQHGGKVHVMSAPGQGSNFTFTLPIMN